MSETAIEKQQQKRRTVMDSLAENQDRIEQALSGALDPVQFMSICARIYDTTPKMRETPWRSFVLACVEAAQLGLTPGGALGECYIIPRWNPQTQSQWAYFQLGYRGAMKLARRGGELLDMSPELVCENDEFHESKGTSRSIHHVPWYCMGHEEPGEVIAAYCTAKLKSGEVAFRTITRAEIDAAASRSGGRNQSMSNVWRDHWEAMALKTAVHRLAKFLPIPDAAKAAIIRDEYREAGVDEATITVDGYEAQRQEILADPVVKARKDYDAAMQKAWGRVGKFCVACGLAFTRDSRDLFTRAVMFLTSDRDPWPEDREARTWHLEKAIEQIDAWAKVSQEEGQALCDEFARLEQGMAAADHFGDDQPFSDSAKSEPSPVDLEKARTDAAFEASQGGE